MQTIIYIVVLVVLQAFIFNRIHVFDVATPLACVYYVIRLPRNAKRWLSMLTSFILGVCIDTFSNTPGLLAASLTFVAFLQPWILELYLRKEDPEDFVPTLSELGFMRYFTYVLIITFIFCFALFSLESFTFTHWYEWLLNVLGSLVITMTLILSAESVK